PTCATISFIRAVFFMSMAFIRSLAAVSCEGLGLLARELRGAGGVGGLAEPEEPCALRGGSLSAYGGSPMRTSHRPEN
ncbi:MAG TPA: hypothetical protein VEU33_02340, partial [Archangium sp.]|nr:hypothetical protein [Archangium sp.]